MITTDRLLANSETREIVHMFLDNLPGRVDKIRQSLISEARRDLKYNAHELKGTAANFGFKEISDAAANLEAGAEVCSMEALWEFVSDVESRSLQAANNLRSIH